MPNLIACRPQSFGKYASRAYETLPGLGIRHVEISAPAPDQVQQTRETLGKHGLQASSLCLLARHDQPDFLERTQECLQAVTALGATVIFTSQHAGDIASAEVYDRLRKAGDLAAASNVTICLETHPDLCVNAAAALETMRGVDHPNIRVNFDPANVHYYNENVDAVDELRQIAAYVRAVHLKDTNGGYRTWHFPAIGEGVVDWKAVFQIMNGQGMTGPFTLEMEGIEGEDLTFEQTTDRIRKSMEYLRREGLAEG